MRWQIANEARSAELAIIISYPTSAQNLVESPRLEQTGKDKGLPLFTCQNIVALNISFSKTHRDSRILHSTTAKKTWQIMWRKRIFKWQPSKLLWIWIFGAVIKVRTTEKNFITSVACYEVVWSHKLVLLNEKRSYTAASIALVNGCIACICSWLLVIYILDVG